MENPENNLYFIPILTVFLSGLFGLLVAVLTWNLASKREKKKFKQDLELREFKEKYENLKKKRNYIFLYFPLLIKP